MLHNIEGKGKNVVYRCNVRTILNTPEAKAALDAGVPVGFGSGLVKGSYRTNATSRSFGRDNEASCERAVVNAIHNLQERVKRNGGQRLTNAVSYAASTNGRFDANRFAPSGQADCIVATFQARTVMRGNVK